MGIELSMAYFLLVCILTAGSIGLSITVATPRRPRIGGICIAGVVLGYLVCSLLLANLWGELMNKLYGQWPSFTLGIIFGVPALVITAGTLLSMLGAALFTIVSGRIPAWILRSQERPFWTRLGIGLSILFVLILLGGFVLQLILRKP
jgi:hypothetical protein